MVQDFAVPMYMAVLMSRYSDKEKATVLAALDANEGNVALTARQSGVPDSTLRGWAKGRGTPAEIAELREHKKEELSERLEAIAHQLVDALPGKIGEASLQQTATSLGITIDKMQILRGGPTDIINIGQITADDIAEARKKVREYEHERFGITEPENHLQ